MIDNDSGNGTTRPIIATINNRCNKKEKRLIEKECRKAGSRKQQAHKRSCVLVWRNAALYIFFHNFDETIY